MKTCKKTEIIHPEENIHDSTWTRSAITKKHRLLESAGVQVIAPGGLEAAALDGRVYDEGELVGGVEVKIACGLDYGGNTYSTTAESELESSPLGQLLFGKQVIAVDSDGHTSEVAVLDGSYSRARIASHPYFGRLLVGAATRAEREQETTQVDAVIATSQFIDSVRATLDGPVQLLVRGGDCPPVVGSFTSGGGAERHMFVFHAGYKGMFGNGNPLGIVHNLADSIRTMNADEGSVDMLVGPGIHAIEVPYSDAPTDMGATLPPRDHHSFLAFYHDEGREKALIHNPAGVCLDAVEALGALRGQISMVNANTYTTPWLSSYRGSRQDAEKLPAVANPMTRLMLSISLK
ncbi:MAG: hypothetical protein AAF413_01500 [Patescibacteria group bacterium]